MKGRTSGRMAPHINEMHCRMTWRAGCFLQSIQIVIMRVIMSVLQCRSTYINGKADPHLVAGELIVQAGCIRRGVKRHGRRRSGCLKWLQFAPRKRGGFALSSPWVVIVVMANSRSKRLVFTLPLRSARPRKEIHSCLCHVSVDKYWQDRPCP